MNGAFLSKLFRNKKMIVLLLIAAAAGAAMMIFGGNQKKAAQTDEIAEYERSVENKIEQTVHALCGGKVYVIVTAECGKQTQYAKNVTAGGEQTVLSSGSPVPVRTDAPVIKGITVVCRNGDDPALCRRLTEAISCAYGISSARICIAPLKY